MPIDGDTRIIAHIGWPTFSFKAPLIFNPYFESIGLNAAVVPMGVRSEDFAVALPTIFRMTTTHGALITMPHKVAVLAMLDAVSPAAAICGSCNAVRRDADGRLVGDMFDGEGFARGVDRKGRRIAGASAVIAGCGGVGSAIAAALAARGLGRLALFDPSTAAMDGLIERLKAHHPGLEIVRGADPAGPDPAGHDIVINATPLGMNADDPLPFDAARISPESFVGEVVMKRETTPFLAAAQARGCQTQVGVDMLFEQIPAYLEFFGFPVATPDRLRSLARIAY